MPWRVSSAAESTVTSFTFTLHLEPSHIGHIAQSECTTIPSSHAWAPRIRWLFSNAGGIDPLVQLLKASGDAKAASAAAGALQNIAAHNAYFAKVVLGAVAAIQPPLAPHPYLVERLKQVATKRMRRREGGVDVPTLAKARPSAMPSWCRWNPLGTLGSRARAQALRRATRALGEVSRGAEHHRQRHAHRF